MFYIGIVFVVLLVLGIFWVKKVSVVPGSSLKVSISEFIRNVKENGFRNELELWIMAQREYKRARGALSGLKGEKPTVVEFMVGVRENGFENELEFLKSLKEKGSYERIVALAFRYKRRTLIYN